MDNLAASQYLWPRYWDSASQGAIKILWANTRAGLGFIIGRILTMYKTQITVRLVVDVAKILGIIVATLLVVLW
jgi:hypothetical protein